MQDSYEDSHAIDDPPPVGFRRSLARVASWSGAVISVALVCLFALWAYRLGVRDAAEIPVIRALDGPVRVQPENPGGQIAENQGLEVNRILAGEEASTPEDTRLAPATLRLTPEDTPIEPVEEEETAVPPPAEESDTAALVEESAEDSADTQDAEIDPESSAALDIDALVASVNDATVADGDDEPAVAIRPRVRPADLAAVQAAPVPDDDPPATTVGSEAEAAPATQATVTAGTLLIQLGAFDSEAIAETQWARLQADHGDLLGGRERFIQRSEQNGRVFYRLRVLGFEARAAQRELCVALEARGVDCIPVTAR